MNQLDERPKTRTETLFEYYIRSSTSHASTIRSILENWYAIFPTEGQTELRARLMRGGNVGFDSAVFELLLNRLALVLGCTTSVHPELIGTAKRCDFLVESPEHGKAILEAVISRGVSASEEGQNARKGMILDALDELETDNFFIGVHVVRQSATSGSGKRLKRFVIEQFGKLHRDEIRSRFEQVGLDGLPKATYQEDGWEIMLTALPKSDSAAGDQESRAVGFEQTGVIELTTADVIRRSLEKKAGRYGLQRWPLLIAVNSLDPFTRDHHFRDALFGDECVRVTTTETGPSFTETRLSNGLWHDGAGPRYGRISGILAFTNATTSRGLDATATLYLNPWAYEPYQGELTRLTTARVHAGRLVTTPGTPLTEVLGLPS